MKVFVTSLKGKRPRNEDAHEIILNLDKHDSKLKNVDFFGIWDGHGGSLVSSYVKKTIPKFFVDARIEYPLNKRYVVNVYDHIQTQLAAQNFAKYCGSTGLIVIHFKFEGNSYLNVINNGDSRCLLCRDNFSIPLTKDHKPNWPEEYHRISALGGKIKYDGFDWRINDLSVSRSHGDIDSTPYVTHRPDLYRYKLNQNDKFFIISCDGSFESLDNNEMINYVLLNCYDSTLTKRINKDINVAEKLAEHAIKKGSQDNVSIIVVFLDDLSVNQNKNFGNL